MTGALTKYDAARAALAEAKNVDEVLDVRDEAERIRLYARQAKDRALMADAMEIQFRAERRLGEMLRDAKDAGQIREGRRPNCTDAEQLKTFTLSEAGIDRKLSSRAQHVAQLAREAFDALLDRSRTKILAGDAVLINPMRDLTQEEKRAKRDARERELGQRQCAFPQKKYGVIYDDPAWKYQVRSEETGMDRAPENHYPTMSLEQLYAMPINDIAADDCVRFMWATIPFLYEAMKLLEHQGFAYKSHYAWGKDQIGPGYWNRQKHEILLIGTRGNVPCPAPGTQWDSLQIVPRGEHSAKPDCFAEMIEAYFPNLPKIELNRRGPPRPGWDAWGNEAELPPHDPETGELIDEPDAQHEATVETASPVPEASPGPASSQEPCSHGSGAVQDRCESTAPPIPAADDVDLPAWLNRANWVDGRPPARAETAIMTVEEGA